MKKLNVSILAFICAVCMAFSVITFMNANVVKADAGVTPTLSATKVMVSKNADKMLLATAIKDKEDVYKVGYTYSVDGEAKEVQEVFYYTSISSGTTTLTPADIFEEAWVSEEGVGMIISEIDFATATAYEYKAFALVGDRNDQGQLVEPAEEVRVTPETSTSKTFYSVEFDTDGGDAIATQIVPAGTPASALAGFVPVKLGYNFTKWQLGGNDIPSGATVTENATLKAVYTEVDYSAYSTYEVSVDFDMRDSTPFDVKLPAELSGYQVVSSKLASYGDGSLNGAVTNVDDETVNVPKSVPNKGENLIRVRMYKDGTYATLEINLVKASVIIKTRNDLKQLYLDLYNSTTSANATKGSWYVLAADVSWADPDTGNASYWQPGQASGTGSAKRFQGTLDGRGYTISDYHSAFGLCQVNEGTIKNVNFEPIIRGMSVGGGVCAQNKGTIENCLIEATIYSVENQPYAGIAKNNEEGVINNCMVILVGYVSKYATKDMNAIAIDKGVINNCYAINNVDSSCPVQLKYMHSSSNTDGLFDSAELFFQNVTSFNSADGWNSYWKIENGQLFFNNAKVI